MKIISPLVGPPDLLKLSKLGKIQAVFLGNANRLLLDSMRILGIVGKRQKNGPPGRIRTPDTRFRRPVSPPVNPHKTYILQNAKYTEQHQNALALAPLLAPQGKTGTDSKLFILRSMHCYRTLHCNFSPLQPQNTPMHGALL